MVRSIDDWFKAGVGRDRRSPDDEYVEYQAKQASFSQTGSSEAGSGSFSRSRKRKESSSWRSGRSDLKRPNGGGIQELIANAERDGYTTSTPEIVAILARRGIEVTASRVEAVKAELRQEARTAAGLSVKPEKRATVPTPPGTKKDDNKSRQNPPSDVPKKRSVTSPDRRSKKRSVAQVVRVVFESSGSPQGGGRAGRPTSVESGPASLSPIRASATAASSKAPSSRAVRRSRIKRPRRPNGQRAEGARAGQDRRPRGRELSLLESAYCPSCGFRPTLNGVCRC